MYWFWINYDLIGTTWGNNFCLFLMLINSSYVAVTTQICWRELKPIVTVLNSILSMISKKRRLDSAQNIGNLPVTSSYIKSIIITYFSSNKLRSMHKKMTACGSSNPAPNPKVLEFRFLTRNNKSRESQKILTE